MTADELMRESNCGIVGMDAELEVYGGYDEAWPAARPGVLDQEVYPGAHDMVPSEKLKLADAMIGRWMRYRAAVERRG